MITKTLTRPMVSFVLLSYLIFLGFFLLMGLSKALNISEAVFNLLQIISAWSSTFAFIILFKRIYPGTRLIDFVKEKFAQKVSFPVVLAIVVIPTLVFAATMMLIPNASFGPALSFSSAGLLFYQFISHLSLGPLGEQLGWRGYMLNELQKKHSPLKSALIKGFLWGVWHAPIWLVSGYTGVQLLLHCAFYLLALMSFAIVITFFYRLNNNLLIPIIIHLVFNFLTSSIVAEFYDVVMYTGILYLGVAVLLIVVNPKGMLYRSHKRNQVTDSIPA